MKNLIKFTFLFILINSFSFASTNLQQVYSNAGPGLGYDRLLILEPDSTYMGGFSASNKKIGIKGYGALIDLAGSSILVNGESQIVKEGKRKGKQIKSLVLGLLEDKDIDNDQQAFLTLKGKCMYFSTCLNEDELLVTSVTSVRNLLFEDWDKIKLGKFE